MSSSQGVSLTTGSAFVSATASSSATINAVTAWLIGLNWPLGSTVYQNSMTVQVSLFNAVNGLSWYLVSTQPLACSSALLPVMMGHARDLVRSNLLTVQKPMEEVFTSLSKGQGTDALSFFTETVAPYLNNPSPTMSSIYVGLQSGAFWGYMTSSFSGTSGGVGGVLPLANYQVTYQNNVPCGGSSSTCTRQMSVIDGNGDPSSSVAGTQTYNHYQRPWYKNGMASFAVSSANPTLAYNWSSFISVNDNAPALNLAFPFATCSLCGTSVASNSVQCRACMGQPVSTAFTGVVATDVPLTALVSKLTAAFPSSSNVVFIVERVTGYLLAASQPVTLASGSSFVQATACSNALIAGVSASLSVLYGGGSSWADGTTSYQSTYSVQVMRLNGATMGALGIDWYLVGVASPLPCTVANCASCSASNSSVCLVCNSGWTLNSNGNACYQQPVSPCPVQAEMHGRATDLITQTLSIAAKAPQELAIRLNRGLLTGDATMDQANATNYILQLFKANPHPLISELCMFMLVLSCFDWLDFSQNCLYDSLYIFCLCRHCRREWHLCRLRVHARSLGHVPYAADLARG